jgi:receptor protein-tyrosine kinase
MTTDQSTPPARYVTLRDYLAVIRRYWLLIALVGLVGAGAGLVNALRQAPTYEATAEVSFQDPAQDLGIVGLGAPLVQTPGTLAAVNADTATSPPVMNVVEAHLKSPYSPQDLAGFITTQVSPESGLLQITADTSDQVFATRLVNATAQALVAYDNHQARSGFAQVASVIRGRIAAINRHAPGSNPSQLPFYEGELPRMQTLAAFARSAQLAVPAQPPASVISSSRARGAVLGLLLGLLLGICVAFVRDSTDRRLRSVPDLRESFRLPVLGHVRAQGLGRVAPLPGSTGHEHAIDVEAFRILRRNLEFLDQERAPRVVLVTSAVPEEGKTTVACSLALALAASGKRTLLVDCDLRRPDVARRLGVPATPGISDYLTGGAEPQDILSTVTLPVLDLADPPVRVNGHNGHYPVNGRPPADPPGGKPARNLVVIAAGKRSSSSAELLASPRFRDFLAEVREGYEAIVLDSSPLLPVSDTLELLPHVDALIVCARASRTTRDQASAALSALARFPERPTGLVVTGVDARDPEYAAYAYSYDYS